MYYCDLFSGCGGVSVGFEEAGFKCVVAVDNDKNAAAIYKENFPTHPFILHDLSLPLSLLFHFPPTLLSLYPLVYTLPLSPFFSSLYVPIEREDPSKNIKSKEKQTISVEIKDIRDALQGEGDILFSPLG